MSTITCVGPNDVDRYFKCIQPLIPGSKSVISRIHEGAGGFVANAASNLSDYGNRVYLLDTVGRDEWHDMIISSLTEHGVLLDGIEEGDWENYVCDILLSGDDRTCLIHAAAKDHISTNANQERILDFSDAVYGTFSSWRHVKDWESRADVMRKRGCIFMFDAERTTFTSLEEDRPLFDNSDILSFNENALEHLVSTSGDDALSRLLESEERIILITLGSKGARILKGNDEIWIPPFKVDAVDPTGAGDMFNSSFLHGWLKWHDPEKAGRFAAAAAAMICTVLGSRPDKSSEEKVFNFIRNYEK